MDNYSYNMDYSNTRMDVPMNDASFGEYFDAQRLRLENLIKDKNRQLNLEWQEDYDKRKEQEQEKNNKTSR